MANFKKINVVWKIEIFAKIEKLKYIVNECSVD